jgi:selenocysteine lyase/cysteine desulfurase
MDDHLAHLVATQFGPFDGRVWLNTAHQGPLPRRAVDACMQAAHMKAAPFRIADESFSAIPERLRALLAGLVGGKADEVVLANGTSHGLHVVANGLPWQPGDDVLLVDGDYPATTLPWIRLQAEGIAIRWLYPQTGAVTATEVAAAITPRTRVLALTWVNSFTGHTVDLQAVGEACRAAGVYLIVNASQAVGARPLDVSLLPVDAVTSCGYKWLCGPYGTGFAWLHPDLLAELRPQQAYWLAMQAGRGLDHMRDTDLRTDLGVRAFDVFCPANFLDTMPWIAALEIILEAGVQTIARHDQQLIDALLDGLDTDHYQPVSPLSGDGRSTLVVLSSRDGNTEAKHRELQAAGIDIAYREGNLRVCPHLFNFDADISRLLDALA